MKTRHISNAFLVAFALCITFAARAQKMPSTNFVPLPVTQERNAAVDFALTQAQTINSMLGICATLDESVAAKVKATWAGWQGRNDAYVEASRAWVLYVRGIIATRQGVDAAVAFQSKVFSDIAGNARTAVLDVLPDEKPQAAICEKAINVANAPALDLRESKEFGADLADILEFHRATLARATQKP